MTVAGVILFNYSQWAALGLAGGDASGASGSLVDAFYFSIVTMSTIGFGDIVPGSSYGRVAIAMQGMLGLIWLAAFAGTIIKRVAR